tara:strand:- start:1586 stop:2635 length:1050 start_codon:yes stop_codon:yes gene_type:complete
MRKKINIVYICIAEKGPSGGGKIIYKHSELINNLNKNFTSQVLHIKKKKYKKWGISINKFLNINNQKYFGWKFSDIAPNQNYKSKWFKNNIIIKNDFNFNKNKDFVILPEIFAHFANDLLIKNKIPYAIFAQNGYCLKPTNNYSALDSAYKNAKFILSYSKDITNCVNLAFPFCKKKIFNIKYSFNEKDFKNINKKSNLITYMPRKLPEHSEHLIFFLRKHLPKSWKIKALHNLKQSEVYNNLCKSKIFLAFSNLEGLPLPPVEAAIAGNKVIGYTGEGGKEYWRKPNFSEISNGDFSKFHSEIINFIKKGKKSNKKFTFGRKKIIKNFSPLLEEKKIKLMLKKINSFY